MNTKLYDDINDVVNSNFFNDSKVRTLTPKWANMYMYMYMYMYYE